MKTLKLSTSNFDQDNTFRLASVKYSTCSLHKDMKTQGDGIYWAMQHGGMLKDHYTDKDREEKARLQDPANQIANGEQVIIEGKVHVCRVLGNYSDAAIFDPI
jgi:hypothetical protein